MCDASDYAIGAALGQRKNKVLHVIYYASRTLTDAQLQLCYHLEKNCWPWFLLLINLDLIWLAQKLLSILDHSALKFLLATGGQTKIAFNGFCSYKSSIWR